MKRYLWLTLIISAFSGILAWAALILTPRSYPVHSQPTNKAAGWMQLTTGSRIAWYELNSQGSTDSTSIPLVYLHGGPGGFIQDRHLQLFAGLAVQGQPVFLYDQAGGGYSARLENIEDYTVDRHLADLDEIIEKKGYQEVILIGQSWGAILATLYTALHPQKVAGLILTSPGPVPPVNEQLAGVSPPDSIHLSAPASTNEEANRKSINLRMKTARLMASRFGVKWVPDQEADQFQTSLDHELNKSVVCNPEHAVPSGPGGGFYCQLMTYRSYRKYQDHRAEIKKIGCPVLILKGSCDNQAWGYTAEYIELIRTSKLQVIPDAGHSISLEQPGMYLELINDFLLKIK